MTQLFKRFVREEEGLETVEYAVMTALIVGTLVLAIEALTGAVSDRFTAVEGTIDGIEAGTGG